MSDYDTSIVFTLSLVERADLLLLLCLRTPPHAATHVSDVRDTVLSEDHAQLVRSGKYFFRPDDSHSGRGPKSNPNGFPVVCADVRRQDAPGPFISGTEPGLRIRFDSDDVDAPGDEGVSRAVTTLDRALHQARMEVALGPGELMIIDNNRCVHGRGAFQASGDGRDR